MRRALGAALLATAVVAGTARSAAADVTPATAPQIAAAIAEDPSAVTSASYTPLAATSAAAVSDTALGSFPTHGTTFGILSSGQASQAANSQSFFASTDLGSSTDNLRGNSDRDASILKVDLNVPDGSNCLSVDFRFLSEEYPDYVGGSYNDAFIAELDTSTWTTSGSSISSPDNFAFGPSNQVISINSLGFASMSAGEASGTAYGGATPLLRASSPVTSGAHSVYLSIFDQGDSIYDSAVFLDNLELFTAPQGECQEGAELVAPSVEKTADDPTSAPEGSNGYTITVENPNDEAISLSQISDTLPPGFSYQNDSTTGAFSFNPVQEGQTISWTGFEGPLTTVPPNGSISVHFNVAVSATPGEYLNEAEAVSPDVDIPPTGPTAPIMVLQTPTIGKTADSPTSQAGAANGYTITITNPNSVPVDIDEISDTLPAGFSYVVGSTTGDVTDNPSIDGQTLTWQAIEGSLVAVPAEGSISLHFGVTVSNTAGEFFNEASAEATGFTTDPTGPTAPVTISAPLPVVLPCDPVTLEGTGAGETLLGGDGIDRIRGLAGRDRIDVLAGDDEACGGLGGDYLYGRDGIDTLRGEEGNDRLYGGRHGDLMEGEAGHDAFLGGRGDDTILAADGTKDCIVTGRGDDTVAADPGLDLVDPPKGCPAGFWL